MAEAVLIVDEDESARNMLYKAIRGAGLEACAVSSGEEALEAVGKRPFNPVVLAAKAKALIRRSLGALSGVGGIITAGPFRYDTSTLRFYKNGGEIILSSKENAMMKLFLDNVNRIFPKDMLYELIWGEAIIDENAIMVYINRLRQKIEEDPAHPKYIQTVRGLGYRFVV